LKRVVSAGLFTVALILIAAAIAMLWH